MVLEGLLLLEPLHVEGCQEEEHAVRPGREALGHIQTGVPDGPSRVQGRMRERGPTKLLSWRPPKLRVGTK